MFLLDYEFDGLLLCMKIIIDIIIDIEIQHVHTERVFLMTAVDEKCLISIYNFCIQLIIYNNLQHTQIID